MGLRRSPETPSGTTPQSPAGAPLAWASEGTGAAPHTPDRVWRRAAAGEGAREPSADWSRPPPPAPRPWPPRSPGEVASLRAGCGAAARGSAAGLSGAAVAGRAPGGARLPSPALSSSSRSSTSLLPATCFPASPRLHSAPGNFGLRGWPPLPAPRRPARPPPAPSLLCCAMRVGFPI